MHDLSVVDLEGLLALDALQVLRQALHVSTQVGAEFFDGLACLHDLLDFLARKLVIVHAQLVRHDALPNIDAVHGEAERVVDEEDGASQLEQAEVFEVEEEGALLRLLFLVRLGLLRLFSLRLIFFLQVQLEDVVNLCLLAHRHVLFALHESVLGVLGQDFACRCFELADDNFGGHNLVDQVAHGHLDDLDAPEDVAPADAADHKLIDLLRSALKEAPIVLGVIRLIVLVSTLLSFALQVLIIGLIIILAKCRKQSNNAFKE